MEIIFQIVLVIGLVLLNGYFVASEFALVAVRKTRIEELAKRGNKTAKLVQGALQDLDSYISSTQLGITIASLALGWVGEPFLAHLFEPLFDFLPSNIAFVTAHALAVGVAFSIITFLHIVLGELAPKTIALQRAEGVALVIIAPLVLFTKLFKPFILVFNGAGNFVIRLVGLKPAQDIESVHSQAEISMILAQSAERGEIEQEEAEMVRKVFHLGEIPVKHIMMPRTDIMAFSMTTSLKDAVRLGEKNMHSRFPIYEQSIDDVIGFVHVKDLYKAYRKDEKRKLMQTRIIREILTVPETKPADEVMKDMRKKRIHIAVVTDEFGGTSGIITLEDIIESLVGEIQDEFEVPAIEIQPQKDGTFLIDGLTPIERVQHKFKLAIRGQGYTTIGGLVFGILGREPRVGDKIRVGQVILSVEEIEGRRIKRLRLKDMKQKKV